MLPDSPSATARPVDARALAVIVQRLHRAAEPPWLHTEVARRMGERLQVIRRVPERIVDWWSWLGSSDEVLSLRYPNAERVGVEPLARPPAPWWARRPWRGRRVVIVEPALPSPGSADLLWSNMSLHFAADIEQDLRRWRKLIATDGFLMFSTLGPGTLRELADLYRQCGWPAPLAPLVDMHDLGDMLVQAAYAEPVMDQELITLTWRDAAGALRELRALGGNAAPDRFAGLRTARWQDRLLRVLDDRRDRDGRVRLTFEVVYGHAHCPTSLPRVAATTQISFEEMRSIARRSRKPDATPGGKEGLG